MFDLQVTQTAMELLPLVCVSLLTWSGTTFAAENEPEVIRVDEGIDVTLPCSVSSKQSISSEMFEWKKDDQKQVFLYNGGLHSKNGLPGQDPQFIGRVKHFPDELKSGNASITIRDTKVVDSGDYTCELSHLKTNQLFHIELRVFGDLKDRTGENIPGSAPKPSIKSLKETKDWARLQCEAHGDPQPELRWQDSEGINLKAEEPQVSKRGDQFYVTLQITVNKTGDYRCVATQEEIRHQIYEETHVYINEKPGFPTGLVVGSNLGTLSFIGVVLGVGYCISQRCKKNGGADYKTSPEEEA